jgi:hypothetical protein
MFCQNCAQPIPDGASSCAACGFTVSGTPGRSPAGEMTEKAAQQAKAAIGSARRALGILALNPVGGLRPAFESLLPIQALQAGIVFSLVFALCFAIGARQMIGGPLLWAGGQGSWLVFALKLTLAALVLVAAMAGAQLLARKAFRGAGCLESDLFVAAISLLPVGLLSLLAALLGLGNAEVILFVSVVAFSFCVMILHSGCREISKIGEPWASLAVPLILLVSGWLAKVILVALM